MRRFFTVLFIVSIVATGFTYYWRTYQPEETVAASEPQADDGSGASAENRSYSRRSLSPDAFSTESYPASAKEPSDRQDLAMMISLVSSVISALAAIFQTWLTSRSVRSRA
ncbi:MAG TPA: hypothetical protein VKA94_09705 [Hyphomicrobiales bacterium]|nr:hypothetical protein [Hyphomicrobiales bacterium]